MKIIKDNFADTAEVDGCGRYVYFDVKTYDCGETNSTELELTVQSARELAMALLDAADKVENNK